MRAEIHDTFLECTQMVDKLTPIFQNKFIEYEHMERLVRNAIVRSQLTGKSVPITGGIQQFLDALIRSGQLEEEMVVLCKQIDEIANDLLHARILPQYANLQLHELKSQLIQLHGSCKFVSDQISLAKKRIYREIKSIAR